MLTPMTPDENIDFVKLEALVEYLIGAGIHGLIPLGSTGEFYALRPTERIDVLRAVIHAAAGRVPVVAGVNAGATREVVYYSQTAEKYGAAGVLVAPPYYSLPRPDELLEHFRLVDRAIGIPIMLYNFPARTGVDMKPELIERLAELKNVGSIKDATGETARTSEIIRRCGDRLQVFCGCDVVVMESFVLAPSAGWRGSPTCARRSTSACTNYCTGRTTRPPASFSSGWSRCSLCSISAASSRSWSRRAQVWSAVMPALRGVRCCRQPRTRSSRSVRRWPQFDRM